MYKVTLSRPNEKQFIGLYSTEYEANEVANNVRTKSVHTYEVSVSQCDADELAQARIIANTQAWWTV
jgi:hypothetical protein